MIKLSEQIKVEYSQYDTSLMDSMINEGSFAHRRGRDMCPYCGYGGTTKQHYKFFRLPNIVQVIWTPNRYTKLSSALIISHRPRKKCRKPSWEHLDYVLLQSWAKKGLIDVDPERVRNQIEQINRQAKEDWESSLCAICELLDEVPDSWWSSWGNCSECGTASAKKKCDRFQETENKLELKRFIWDRWMLVGFHTIEDVDILKFTCPKCGDIIVRSKGAARQHANMEIQRLAKIRKRECDFPFRIMWDMHKERQARAKAKRKEIYDSALE